MEGLSRLNQSCLRRFGVAVSITPKDGEAYVPTGGKGIYAMDRDGTDGRASGHQSAAPVGRPDPEVSILTDPAAPLERGAVVSVQGQGEFSLVSHESDDGGWTHIALRARQP